MNGTSAGVQTLLVVGLVVFAGLCVFLCAMTSSDRDNVADFLTAGSRTKPWAAGLAMAGECTSAISFLGITAVTSLNGFDGLSLSVALIVGLAFMALLLAYPMRRLGRLTVGDALAERLPAPSVRIGLGLATVAVCLPMLIEQLVGVGVLTSGLLGLNSEGGRQSCIVIIGIVMVSMTVSGGMRGTGLVQVVKVVVLTAVVAGLAVLVLGRFGGSPDALLAAASARSGAPDHAFLGPGPYRGPGVLGDAERLGELLTTTVAAAVAPQVTMRIFSVSGWRPVRKAMRWAVGWTTLLHILFAVLAFGAAGLIGATALRAADPTGAVSVLALAGVVDKGGKVLTAVGCAAFLTGIAAVASIAMAAATALTHDVYANVVRRGASDRVEIRTVRGAAALIGVVAVLFAAMGSEVNLQVLAALATTLGASTLAPVLVYGMLWPRFTKRGALWCLWGASALSLVLIAGSPYFSGGPLAVFPDRDFQFAPLLTPGLVTAPVGFLLGWVGSVTDRQKSVSSARFARLEAQAVRHAAGR